MSGSWLKGLAALLLVGSFPGCSHREPLPVLGQVQNFTLTDQTGKPFSPARWHGHVWLADFIYTSCPGPCPLMSRRMDRVQAATAGITPEVKLVSFTIDPVRDTPPVMAAYAKRFNVSPARWVFLTGDPAVLQVLDRNVFKLGDLNPEMSHSTRFALVDGKGRIRAYYGMSDEHMVERVTSDAEFLSKESS